MYYTDAPEKKPTKPIIIKKSKKESPFEKSKRIQTMYERALRGVAKEVNKLIKAYNPTDILSVEKLKKALTSYSDIIDPWAKYISSKVINDVANQDKRSWQEHSREMSLALREQIMNAPIGETYQNLMQSNVDLIKSIPLDAAERVHGLVTENLMHSARASEIAEKIFNTNNIMMNRATLIARTETSRAATLLTQARATSVGSTFYIWRTSNDKIVRLSHRKMNGRQFRWDSPPVLSDGTVTHPGCIYNCRCYAEPVISDLE